MTPEEKKLIAHIVKVLITLCSPEDNKLIALAERAGIIRHNSSILEVDDTPCKIIPVYNSSKTDIDVTDLYMECSVYKNSSIYKVLESALVTSRKVDLSNIVVLNKRVTVRDGVEVIELNIGDAIIHYKQEGSDDEG